MAALKDAHLLVLKIGSALLVERSDGSLRTDWLAGLAADVAVLQARGTRVILVSSGSVALGRQVLNLPSGTLPLEQSQAAAAVGQIRLARAYQEALGPLGIITAQVLMTLEDTSDRKRYLNARATLRQLLSLGVVPIVNENDTVATEEIRFGDNDRLAAQIAVTVGADQLILLSDVDGLYSGDPNGAEPVEFFPVVDEITPEIEAMAGDPISGLSKGGMKTKLLAAKTTMAGGCAMAITEGSVLRPLKALEEGARCTWFTAQGDPHTARKRWIDAMKPRGEITIDAGAVRALNDGNSLLPAGVVALKGGFGRGAPVAIVGLDGVRVGVGLSRYTAKEARAIKGAQSGDIEAILGYPGRAALIHRDDMVI